MSNIKFHRVKHLPTGLYYQPGSTNLSEKGKMYSSNSDVISANFGHCTPIRISKSSKVYLRHKEIIDKYANDIRTDALMIFANTERDLVREEINMES